MVNTLVKIKREIICLVVSSDLGMDFLHREQTQPLDNIKSLEIPIHNTARR